MRWSWGVGRVLGTEIRIHWTFLLLLGWIAAQYLFAGSGLFLAAEGVIFVLAVFACVVLHELGHAMMARYYGVQTQDITLLPIGGVARLERIPREPNQEFWIAVAGPAVNIVIAGILVLVLGALGSVQRLNPERLAGTAIGVRFLVQLFWVNVMLVLFNALPAFPMDGGRVLRSVLARAMSYPRATQIAARVGQAMAILFGIAGLLWNPWLLLIAIFVYLGAESESEAAQVTSVIEGVPVRAAMMTRFAQLAPDDSLQRAADELLAGAQQDFPVVEGPAVVGLLRRQDLVNGLKDLGPEHRVRDVMATVPCVADDSAPLSETLELMRESGCSALPVLHENRLVGLITLENVGELLMLRSAQHAENGKTESQDRFRAA